MQPIFSTSKGFSLVELTVMIIIIGILASVAMQSMTSVVEDARQVKTRMEMQLLADAIVGNPDLTSGGVRFDFGYIGDVGAFPSNLDNLIANPGGFSTWDGPYLSGRFSQDTIGMKTDEWGTAYGYTGGITISSTGSGNTITKKIADATSDYLLNSLNGAIRDSAESVPGITYLDSVNILITIPNGGGGMVTKTYFPDSAGIFLLDSLPAGTHSLDIIYKPNVDTLHRYVTILPRHKSAVSYKFASAYFTGGGGGGGGGSDSSSSEILRPNGTGFATNLILSGCSQNWECLDEAISDGEGSYVEGSGAGYLSDIYAVENSSVGSGAIDSVVVYMNCVGSGGGKKARTAMRTGGTIYEGSEINLTSVTVYTAYSTAYAISPITSLAWNWTEIDNLEVGVSIFKQGRCTQVWVEVYYTY